jgi:hypothetical protein
VAGYASFEGSAFGRTNESGRKRRRVSGKLIIFTRSLRLELTSIGRTKFWKTTMSGAVDDEVPTGIMDGLRRIAEEQNNRQDAASEVLENQVRELPRSEGLFRFWSWS